MIKLPKMVQARKESDKKYRTSHKGKTRRKHNLIRWKIDNPDKVRSHEYKKNYGITLEDYQRMYTEQGGICAICCKGGSKLGVDHNHRTGKVRALLCNTCNGAVGFVKEDILIASAVVSYLRKYNGD